MLTYENIGSFGVKMPFLAGNLQKFQSARETCEKLESLHSNFEIKGSFSVDCSEKRVIGCKICIKKVNLMVC